MIESAIIDALKADSTLRKRVTVYADSPAIFSELAPEEAKMPYVTINITRSKGATDDNVLQDFTIMVDFWDYGTKATSPTRVRARQASERIEFILDNKQFTHDRYDTIRVWFFSGGWVEDEDTRAIHYNQQFTARASRKRWICNL